VGFELSMRTIVIALDGRLFEGSIHSIELAVGPGMVRLGQTPSRKSDGSARKAFRRLASTNAEMSLREPRTIAKCRLLKCIN
jgi:hypothetical protein